MHGELAGTVAGERVAVTGKSVHVLERGGVQEECQALLEVLPVTAKPAFARPLLGAALFELLVRPNDLDDAILEQSITLGVIV